MYPCKLVIFDEFGGSYCGDCILIHLLVFPVDVRARVSYGCIYCMYTFLLLSE